MVTPVPHSHPHADAPVLTAGTPLAAADAAVILIHGRGASAADILELSRQLTPAGIAFLAPQAANSTWYPLRFLEPIAQNEPYLSSALALIAALVAQAEAAGIASSRIAIVGFSQGACLALEFAARHPARYGGVYGFSGGLIGPPGTTWPDFGSLDGTPIFLGCSDVDSHIPIDRVIASADRLRELGAEVDMRIYPGMGHTINKDEIVALRTGIEAMLAQSSTFGEGSST